MGFDNRNISEYYEDIDSEDEFDVDSDNSEVESVENPDSELESVENPNSEVESVEYYSVVGWWIFPSVLTLECGAGLH